VVQLILGRLYGVSAGLSTLLRNLTLHMDGAAATCRKLLSLPMSCCQSEPRSGEESAVACSVDGAGSKQIPRRLNAVSE